MTVMRNHCEEQLMSFSQHRLRDWVSALQKENNSLGQSLAPYADAWHAEVMALQTEIERLREALRDVADLAGWHSDDEADANDQSPEDMTAHVNGLIRQTCWRALEGDS